MLYTLTSLKINSFTTLQHNADHVHVAFSSPQRTTSTAILNGGLTHTDHILNLKVPSSLNTDEESSATYKSSSSIYKSPSNIYEAPDISLQNYANAQGWQGKVVGMMTAASMNSLRIEQTNIEGVDLAVIVTTGLGNARRAGDKADVQELLAETKEIGTINLILICSAKLTDAAMLEAIMLATEAKAAALQDAGILSPVSNQIATGTGTDSIAIVSGNGPEEIAFCGKHVLLGEWIGRLVIDAVGSSIAGEFQ